MSTSPVSAESRDWAQFRPGATHGTTFMRAHFTEHSFERHSHETYSIGLTSSGVQTFHCGGTAYASLPGDIILFNPDQAHDGQRGTADGFGYAMLYIDAATIADCRDTAAGLDFAEYFKEPLVRDADVAQAFRRVLAADSQGQEHLRSEELLRGLVAGLLAKHGERRSDGRFRQAASARLERVREFLRERYEEDVTVEQLAGLAGLSRAHLTRAFTQRFGIPPHIYLNAVRLRQARQSMLRGAPLAEVATSCGFADQSHFTRRFKGATGLTPSDWMRQMRST